MLNHSVLDLAAARLAPLHTLVVEDDDDSRALMATLLVVEGAHALALASRGEEGLARLRLDAYDLIVMDIALSGMSGLEMLDVAKSEGLIARTTLVICTAQERVRASVARRGAILMPKPIDANALVDVVRGCRDVRVPSHYDK